MQAALKAGKVVLRQGPLLVRHVMSIVPDCETDDASNRNTINEERMKGKTFIRKGTPFGERIAPMRFKYTGIGAAPRVRTNSVI